MAINIDDLRKMTEEKFESYQVEIGDEVLTLRNPIRLPEERRKRVVSLTDEFQEIQEKLEEDDSNSEELSSEVHLKMIEIISACADNENLASDLVSELKDDLGLTQVLFEDWFGADDLGEASNSSDESTKLEAI